MVRNVASMQSLRHNLEDMNFDTPPRRTLYEESAAPIRSQPSFTQKIPPPQPQQHPIVQLCGSDAYTKNLMNRVATGTATEAEQKEFAQQVQRGLPSLTNTVAGSSPPQEDKAARFKQATRENAEKYTKPFCDFLTDNPTVFHCVDAVKTQLKEAGWKELSERDAWKIEPQGKYFVERNGSALMAFSVGGQYKPGNGAAILAGHVDALTAKLKPVSQVPNKAGYIQLGVAPYAGAPNNTWWDRDLGIGGRVLVKEGSKIVSKLVKLDWPIARIPTLAPHFGAAAQGPFNPETQMVPIIGLEDSEKSEEAAEPFSKPSFVGSSEGGASTFASTQPPRLVRAIAKELGIKSNEYGNIINWELELFDVQPATVGGLDKEFIFAGRVDDKLCSWAAIQALIDAQSTDTVDSSIIKAVGLFDNEEIGSLLRQGARGNFLPSVVERAVTSLNNDISSTSIIGQTYANSFLVSSDVIHAVNPNFLNAYLENHSPRLNVGIVVSADSNGHMTTDSVSTAIMQRCADKVGAKLQVFQIRNDSRSGGTVGPMLSSATGIRAIDCGIPQLSMHSVRATTGNLDPGLGVMAFLGFLNGFESVDEEFR
jgi:aminopeptidase I